MRTIFENLEQYNAKGIPTQKSSGYVVHSHNPYPRFRTNYTYASPENGSLGGLDLGGFHYVY